MKKIIALLLVVWAVHTANAQNEIFIPGYDKEIDDEITELFPPYETVHSGRELPRTFTVAYPDEESAREGSLAPSLYLQPMTGEPQVADTGTHMEYSWSFKVPFAWVGRMVSVYIASADNPYSVLVNGETSGSNQSSRSPAEFDVTSRCKEGVNRLTIRVEKDPPASVLTSAPGSGRITGDVLVLSQPRIRVRDYVYEVNFDGDDPTLQLGIILKTQMLNPRSVRIHYSLRDVEGVTVSSGHRDVQVGRKEEDTVRFFLTVRDLKPWTYETPHLYDLTIGNQYEGRYTEYVNYRTGFRNIRFDKGGLYTDSYRIPLSLYMMPRIPEGSNVSDLLSSIREEGYNVVIAGAYPQSEEFYETCDRIGLYVCDQADINTSLWENSGAGGSNPTDDPRWSSSFTDRALTMYGRSANHPSVAMFSIARNSSNGYNLYESYLALKNREPDRPVIYPEGGGQWNSDAVSSVFAGQYPGSVGRRIVLDPPVRQEAFPEGGSSYIKLFVDAHGKCLVENRAMVTPLKGDLVYTVKRGSKLITQGTIAVALEPGASGEFKIPVPLSEAGKKIKFEASLRSNLGNF